MTTESTSTDPWSTPSESSTSEYLDIKDQVGKLLLITPTKYLEHQKTKFNADADVVVANVAVIDEKDPEKSEEHADVWLLQGRLIRATKGKVGNGMVLGRLNQQETDKGNPAYDLSDPTDEDKVAARKFYATKAPPF